MTEKPGPDLASQMQAARDLLEEGEVRDALVLAMEVLWRELDQLRDTLQVVKESLPQGREMEEVASRPVEPAIFEIDCTPRWHLLH